MDNTADLRNYRNSEDFMLIKQEESRSVSNGGQSLARTGEQTPTVKRGENGKTELKVVFSLMDADIKVQKLRDGNRGGKSKNRLPSLERRDARSENLYLSNG